MKKLFRNIFYLLLLIIVIVGIDISINEYLYSSGYGAKTNIGNGKYFQDSALGIYTVGSIRMKAGDSITYNGVTLTSGSSSGGDVTKSGNNVFTGYDTANQVWIFNDTLKANSKTYFTDRVLISDSLRTTEIVNMDSLKVANTTDSKYLALTNSSSYIYWNTGALSKIYQSPSTLNFEQNNFSFANKYLYTLLTLDSITGLVLSQGNNINFSSGKNAWIKNVDNYALYLGTNSDTSIKIDSLNNVRVFENMTVDGNITVSGNVNGVQFIGGDIDADNIAGSIITADDGSGIQGLNGTNITNGTINTGRIDDSTFKLTNLDTTRFLDLSDTSKYYHIDTLQTENIKSVSNFWNIISFYATANINAVFTFVTSPIFSAVVNFANGLTTTTMTASGTVTFNGDMVNNGWKKIGSASSRDQYLRDTMIRQIAAAVGSTVTTAHGIPNHYSIVSWNVLIVDDSLTLLPGANWTSGYRNPGFSFSIDATNLKYFTPLSAYSIPGDTLKWYIKYTDYNR